jgi:pimeloyl-ACP methyl ester carboxylesterase
MQTTQTADGTAIEYERHGDGRPLILLHGGMAPPEYWQPVLPHFEGYAAIVPQRPGFGTCLDGPEETGPGDVLEREVAYVRALVDDVADPDAEPPVLLGHSFGALTAVETARALTTDGESDGIETVVAYEPAVLPEAFAEHADLADRMQARLDDGDIRTTSVTEGVSESVEAVSVLVRIDHEGTLGIWNGADRE